MRGWPAMQQTACPSSGCSYAARTCTRACLDGYDYCLHHILEDRSAPYKQCNFVYTSNGRRCIVPTLKGERKDTGFCSEHSRKAQMARQKSSRRHIPPPSTETLLMSLSHYGRPENIRNAEPTSNGLVEIDAAKINNAACRILDYASESDSDLEVATFDSTWRGIDQDSSDTDSIDGSLEDPSKMAGHAFCHRFATFRHAGIYTAEEVTQLTRDKLIRLQSLYIDQFRRLQLVLKERRRKYLHALKREKETLSSIHKQRKDSLKEQRLYKKLKSLNRYQKRSGVEAVLHKKTLERRAMATEGVTVRPPPTAKCVFTEGGVKCGLRTLPLAKHCLRHILTDAHQVLFRACGCAHAGFPCEEPVPAVFEGAACVFHAPLAPPHPHLSASHIKAEDDASEKRRHTRADVRPVIGASVNPVGRPLSPDFKQEKDPSDSFNSETSTTETASMEESMENVEHMEEC